MASLVGAQATGYAHPAPDAMGPRTSISLPAFAGTFDRHTVLYIYTDSFDKARAQEDHVAYSPSLVKLLGSAPPLYFVTNGGHARGPIFTNRPGEAGYTPFDWVVAVAWKMPAASVALESDEQIRQLARRGMLTLTRTGTVINAPVVEIMSGEAGPESGGA